MDHHRCPGGGGLLSVTKRICFMVVLLLSMSLLVEIEAQATTNGAFPAPDLPYQCNSIERCCMPSPYTGAPGIRQFEYDTNLSMRIRPAAHLVDATYRAKLEKAYKLIRALPDTDPRSLLNQMKLHCLYCDNALYYPGQLYPIEIHNGWLFLPWHRMFLYFHERILGKLLGDDSFALPYWAWDNTEVTDPLPNVIPAMYADPASPLYDAERNNCSRPPFVADLDTTGGCTNKTSDYLRIQNARLQYTQLVIGAPTTSLFYGMPYKLGDFGGSGPGTLEDEPHGTIHAWVGNPDAQRPRFPFDDMGNFGRAAIDPIFYTHHANIDRLWSIWQTIPGGNRTHPNDASWLDSQFTFYDENANLVKMNVSQTLDTNLLRYKNQELPTPWLTNGVNPGKENTIPLCNPLSTTQINDLILKTPTHSSIVVLGATPLTFRVDRPARNASGTEVLEISGLQIPKITDQVHLKGYLFFPQVEAANGPACPEFFGAFNFIPHVGQSTYNPGRVWRAAIGPKLVALGKDYVGSIVVTIVQIGSPRETRFKT